MEKLYPIIWKKLGNENITKRYELSARLLKKGVDEGLFMGNVNIEIVSKLFHEQVSFLSDDVVFPRERYNHVEVFQNIVINFVRGISTSKGIQIIDKVLE